MSNLQQLLDQRSELDKQIENTRRQERADALSQIKNLMNQHALTVDDLDFRSSKASTRKGNKVATKYCNATTGETWSGRGLQPKWLKSAIENGRQLEDFLV